MPAWHECDPQRSPAALAHLLAVLAGRSVMLEFARSAEIQRPVLRADALILPPPDGAWCVESPVLAAIVHAAAHLRFSLPSRPVGRLGPIAVAVASTVEDARVERLMIARYPGLASLLESAARRVPGKGLGPAPGLCARLHALHRVLLDARCPDADPWLRKASRLFEAERARLAEPGRFERIAAVLANDLGQMRVRTNLQTDQVPYAYGDDHSYLWHFGRSRDDDAIEQIVRAGAGIVDPVRRDRAEAAPAAARLFSYPEWDFRLGRHREDWCTVIERSGAALPAEFSIPDWRRASRASRIRADRRARVGAQYDGEDLDLDAAISTWCDRRAGTALDVGCYWRMGRHAPPRITLVLLDLSASISDPGSMRHRVLDTLRELTLALANRASAQGEAIAVHGFSSDGRHRIDYRVLAGFAHWRADAIATMLGGLATGHSTRLGAAVRHASALLAGARCPPGTGRRLVVIGDGEASDIDVFAPNYLEADATNAVRDARRIGQRVRCLAIEADRASAAVRVFGRTELRRAPPAGAGDSLARALAHWALG